MTKRVLYDTNVLLDVVLLRAPFVDASAAALDLVTRTRRATDSSSAALLRAACHVAER